MSVGVGTPETGKMSTRSGGLPSIAAHGAFHLFLLVSLTTPSWRYGLYLQWPIVRFEEVAGGPADIGILNLLPFIVLVGWLVGRRLNGGVRGLTPGPRWLFLPFLGLTVLGLLSLQPEPFRRFFLHMGMLALAWLVYLFTVNEQPRLAPTLALVLGIQGVVAIGQFARQADLGLRFLGELPLNPLFEGVSVVVARGVPWLRAYGLTAHPNLLAAILVLGLLLVLPTRRQWPGPAAVLYGLAVGLGLAGLFLSFSRAGWLAFAVGLLTAWLLAGRRLRPTRRQLALGAALAASLGVLLLLYGDLVYSRFFNLSAPSEAQSINQRLHDARVALEIIEGAPVLGVGMGNYPDAAVAIDADSARVHNVALFVTAEMGLIGLALWLWLMAAPPWVILRGWRQATAIDRRRAALQLAPWAAMLVINLFDTMLWLTSNWQTSILFALLLANVVRPLVETQPQVGSEGAV